MNTTSVPALARLLAQTYNRLAFQKAKLERSPAHPEWGVSVAHPAQEVIDRTDELVRLYTRLTTQLILEGILPATAGGGLADQEQS